jgi:hypothetical protein
VPSRSDAGFNVLSKRINSKPQSERMHKIRSLRLFDQVGISQSIWLVVVAPLFLELGVCEFRKFPYKI